MGLSHPAGAFAALAPACLALTLVGGCVKKSTYEKLGNEYYDLGREMQRVREELISVTYSNSSLRTQNSKHLSDMEKLKRDPESSRVKTYRRKYEEIKVKLDIADQDLERINQYIEELEKEFEAYKSAYPLGFVVPPPSPQNGSGLIAVRDPIENSIR